MSCSFDEELRQYVSPYQSTETALRAERVMREMIRAARLKQRISIDELPDSRFEPIAVLDPMARGA